METSSDPLQGGDYQTVVAGNAGIADIAAAASRSSYARLVPEQHATCILLLDGQKKREEVPYQQAAHIPLRDGQQNELEVHANMEHVAGCARHSWVQPYDQTAHLSLHVVGPHALLG